jgi:diguanylate cyclase (GGDEF)-like protein
LAPGGGAPHGEGDGAAAATGRRAVLYAYTAASIVAGLGALAWTTLQAPIAPAIDPGLDGTPLGGPGGGALLWIAFGLAGSLRVLPIPGGSGVWTFHMPFIAAAMALGGPTAGAWVGFLSTIERRELESQPWYGVLANHAVMAFAAVVGGLTVQVVGGALAAVGANPGLAQLGAIALGTLVLAGVANGIAAGTIMLRERLSAMALVEILVRSFGGITLAEIALAWVFVTLFTTAGWWAPLALAVLVLLIWPREGVEFIDPLMKLPRDRMFRRELDGVLARTRRGLAPGGLLLLLDLDGFGRLNKDHGQHVGDEVLAEVGERLRLLTRATDFAGRRGGDELAMFYAGVVDVPTARRLARRVDAAIRRPIATTAGVLQVGVSIGALIVRPAPEIPSTATLMQWADAEVQIAKSAQKSGRATSGIRFHAYGSSAAGSPVDADTGVEAAAATTPTTTATAIATTGATRRPEGAGRLLGLATMAAALVFGAVLVAFTLSRILAG